MGTRLVALLQKKNLVIPIWNFPPALIAKIKHKLFKRIKYSSLTPGKTLNTKLSLFSLVPTAIYQWLIEPIRQIALQKNEIINLYLKCSRQRTFKIDIKKSSLNLVPKSLGLILTIKGWGCFNQSQVKNAVYLLNFDSIRVQFWQGILCLFSLVLTAISQWLIKPMRQIVLQKNEIINLYLKLTLKN